MPATPLAAVAFSLILLGGSADSGSQTLYLKDGSVLRGTVGATTADSVTIETANGALTIPRAEVLRIEFGAGEATAPPVVAPAAAAPPPAWEPPAAIASPLPAGRGWAGYVNAFAGSRSMNSTWDPVASQGQVALETTFLPPGWDVGVAVDLTSSY